MSATRPPSSERGGEDELSLAFAADINPILIEAFLEEAPQHGGRLSEAIGRLASGGGALADVTQAQRVAHSLKGSANLTGVRGIASLTHHLEDLLDHLADAQTLPSPGVASLLLEAGDCVSGMVDALGSGGRAPRNSASVVASLRRWRELLEPDPDAPAPAVQPRPDAAPVVNASARAEGGSAVHAPPSMAHSLRVPTRIVDNLLKLAGELAISNVQAQGSHRRMTGQSSVLREQYRLVQQRLLDLQDMVEVRGISSGSRAAVGGRARGGRSTHSGTQVQGFDPLELDEYNELHSKYQALAESVSDFCEVALGMRQELLKLDDTIVDQQRISKDLSDTVLSARMVAVGVIELRLQRGVRETCRMTGKHASLAVTGTSLLMDGDVLNALVDPLLHLLRNAIDHGIESAEKRVGAGKPLDGQIRLDFSREGDSVLVQCIDDGAGFDVRRIRAVAQQRGLVAESQPRTDCELLHFAMLPGFSTRDDATQVSGRGIGMDVVSKAVAELKGSMEISSSPGAGARVMLRVPVTLISMHVLLVRAGSQVCGVPSGSLRQVLFCDAGRLQRNAADYVFGFEDTEFPVRYLCDLVGQPPGQRGGVLDTVKPLLLLDADAGPTAVFVDEAVDGRYLVVKALGEMMPKPPGVIGAAILGDGAVAPVLDLRVLLRRASVAPLEATLADMELQIPHEDAAPEVLIVDDSLTARRMLSVTIGDGGYRVRTANDGLDAIDAMEDGLPDLVVTDLEMPRMNGLELAAHLRGETRTRDLPVLMVTSRSTDKHRNLAATAGINGFITKPYSNEDLLSSIQALLSPVGA